MKKTVFALFLIGFFVFCFVGNGGVASGEINIFGNGGVASADVNFQQENAFRIMRQADTSGKIALSYIFPVNSAVLTAEGFSETEIKTYRFYLSTYVNALAGQNRDKAGEGVTVSNCTYFVDVDGLGFSIVFDNLDAQKAFFGSTDDEEEKNEKRSTKVSGFFIRKTELFTTFPISSTDTADELKLVCKMATTSWCEGVGIGEEKKSKILGALDESVYIYDFASTSEDLKSEVMYDDENFHHNFFVKSYADLAENNQISFYTTYPNTPIWYASALVSVILGMAIAYFILKNRRKN